MTIYSAGDLIADQYEVIQGPREKPSLAGGMGLVFLCQHCETGTPFAVKTVKDEFLKKEITRERFIQEATTWINLEKHRNIVQARSVLVLKGKPHIFLEYIPGAPGYDSNLRSWLRRGRLGITTTLDFAIQLCMGMEYAQKKIPGLVHRDIKPENILIASDKTVKITDFGLSKAVNLENSPRVNENKDEVNLNHASLTWAGNILGTPPYMSPEQCRGGQLDSRSDIYAFGCVLYEMLTGRWVFRTRTNQEFIHCHLSETPISPSQLIPSLQGILDKLVMKCLEKEPQLRYPTFRELIKELVETYKAMTGNSYSLDLESSKIEAGELGLRGMSLRSLGKPEAAIEYFDRALRLDPMEEFNWAGKAYALNDLGQYIAAIECTNQALNINPNYATAWLYKGNALDGLEKYPEAIVCYDKALEIDPKDVIALSNKANVLDMLGRSHEALKLYERALAIDSVGEDAVEPLYNSGVVLTKLAHWDEALQCFKQALQINPTRADAWTNKGAVLFELDRNEEALECFDLALEYSPQNINAWTNKASVLLQMQRCEEALNCCNTALQINRQYATAWQIKSKALFCLGLLKESIACVDQWIEIDNKNPDAWFEKGRLSFGLGELQETQICLNAVLSLAPDYPQAQKLASLVQKRSMVQHLVELGKMSTFQIPGEVFDQLDEEFFTVLEMEVVKLRFEGQHKAANWLENDLRSALVTTSLLGIGKRAESRHEPERQSAKLEQVQQAQIAFDSLQQASSLDEVRQVVAKFPFMLDPNFINAVEKFIAEQVPLPHKAVYGQRLTWLRQVTTIQSHSSQSAIPACKQQSSTSQTTEIEQENPLQPAVNAFQEANSLDEMRQMVEKFPVMTSTLFIALIEQFMQQIPSQYETARSNLANRLTWLRKIANEQENLTPKPKKQPGFFGRIFKKRD